MIPHERSLVKSMKDRPFAIVGVKTDTPEVYTKKKVDLPVTWRSFADGPEGPICKRWSIGGFPTIYVLDHRGVIRYIDVRDDDLAKAVTTLVEQAEKAAESR